MKSLVPLGLDCDWVWPNGAIETRDVPPLPELDRLPIYAVLPVLLERKNKDANDTVKDLRRLRGAHYTPTHLVSKVLQSLSCCTKGKVIDPAMGAGVWLCEWLEIWTVSGCGTVFEGLTQIYGTDVILAVAVARFYCGVRLIGILKPSNLASATANGGCLSLDLEELWPECGNGFDLILGNPPWLS